jgi:hypothetical protein
LAPDYRASSPVFEGITDALNGKSWAPLTKDGLEVFFVTQLVSLRLREHLRHPFPPFAISDINTISAIIYFLYPSWLASTVEFDQSGQTGVGVGKVHRNLQERGPNLLRHSHIHLDFSFPTKFSAVDFFCIATAGKALLPSLGNALPFLFRGDRRRSLRFEGT